MGHWAQDITQIAALLIGVAAVALLVGHAQGTGSLITAGTSGFNQLLNTVELTGTASAAPYQPQSGGFSGSLQTPSLGAIGG